MDHQQGHTLEHRELWSMLCGSLGGRGVWRKDICICMAESFHCSPGNYYNIVNHLYCNTKEFKEKNKWIMDKDLPYKKSLLTKNFFNMGNVL